MTKIEQANREVCEKLGLPCYIKDVYPDFSTEAGRVRLLKLMMARKDRDEFLDTVGFGGFGMLIDLVRVDYMTDDTGRFLFAVRDWLAETKHPPMCASGPVVEDGNY